MTGPIRGEPPVLPAWRRLLEGWRRVGRAIGDVQARILLTLFYFLVLGPFAVGLRALADPLSLKAGTPRGWRPRADEEPASLTRAMRQS
jgi:hypothetical protein